MIDMYFNKSIIEIYESRYLLLNVSSICFVIPLLCNSPSISMEYYFPKFSVFFFFTLLYFILLENCKIPVITCKII
ncbi:unnamed protein product [Diabrotica balteata]|uniref:Uncharacterized protein n=1 Tax=Diabrotica balteata TaxID=107213 RepID=A0A9P0DU47_DIABA|nr:unnamed protein product [Diabrotica balteata]